MAPHSSHSGCTCGTPKPAWEQYLNSGWGGLHQVYTCRVSLSEDDVAKYKLLRKDNDGNTDNRRVLRIIQGYAHQDGSHWAMVKGIRLKGRLLYVDVDNIIAGEKVQGELNKLIRFLGLSPQHSKGLPQRYVVAISNVTLPYADRKVNIHNLKEKIAEENELDIVDQKVRNNQLQITLSSLHQALTICSKGRIYIDGVRKPVRPWDPNFDPKFCFRCRRYGHLAVEPGKTTGCRKDPRCGSCGGDHETKGCKSLEHKCVHCAELEGCDDINHPDWRCKRGLPATVKAECDKRAEEGPWWWKAYQSVVSRLPLNHELGDTSESVFTFFGAMATQKAPTQRSPDDTMAAALREFDDDPLEFNDDVGASAPTDEDMAQLANTNTAAQASDVTRSGQNQASGQAAHPPISTPNATTKPSKKRKRKPEKPAEKPAKKSAKKPTKKPAKTSSNATPSAAGSSTAAGPSTAVARAAARRPPLQAASASRLNVPPGNGTARATDNGPPKQPHSFFADHAQRLASARSDRIASVPGDGTSADPFTIHIDGTATQPIVVPGVDASQSQQTSAVGRGTAQTGAGSSLSPVEATGVEDGFIALPNYDAGMSGDPSATTVRDSDPAGVGSQHGLQNPTDTAAIRSEDGVLAGTSEHAPVDQPEQDIQMPDALISTPTPRSRTQPATLTGLRPRSLRSTPRVDYAASNTGSDIFPDFGLSNSQPVRGPSKVLKHTPPKVNHYPQRAASLSRALQTSGIRSSRKEKYGLHTSLQTSVATSVTPARVASAAPTTPTAPIAPTASITSTSATAPATPTAPNAPIVPPILGSTANVAPNSISASAPNMINLNTPHRPTQGPTTSIR